MSLYKIAEQLQTEYEDRDALQAEMVRRILEDEDLTVEAINLAASTAIGMARRFVRRTIETKGCYVPSRTYDTSTQREVEKRVLGYLAWPLMDGTPLGQATKSKLLKDAGRFEANAKGNARDARFLRLVAAKLRGDEQIVEDALSPEQVERLMIRARNEGNALDEAG